MAPRVSLKRKGARSWNVNKEGKIESI